MLLQRLVEHARSRTDLPTENYRSKQIHWAVLLSTGAGTRPVLVPRARSGRKNTVAPVPVPDTYRCGVKPLPYLLADTAEYVLGVPKCDKDLPPTEEAVADAVRRNADYRALVRRWLERAEPGPRLDALRAYLGEDPADGTRAPLPFDVPDEVKAGDNVAIMADHAWLHDDPAAVEVWREEVADRKAAGHGICLVCGRTGQPLLASLPDSVAPGLIPTSGQSRKAQLVSVNTLAQARGGKKQLANTPVCVRCGSASIAALNALLADPDHRYRTKEGVLVWWTREPVSDVLAAVTDPEPEDVAELLASVRKHPDPATVQRVDDNAFYALTLAQNNGRVVVRDWIDVPLSGVRRNIAAWLDDHRTHDPWQDADIHLPLWLLALATGRHDSGAGRYVADSALDGIAGDLLRAALRGSSTPARLLPHLVQRIRADRDLGPARLALLRLHLNRTRTEELRPVPQLDEHRTDPAYLCGRLFAALEDIQRAVLPDLNTTLGDKYFGTAMTAPRHVMASLMRGAKQAHLKQLRRDRPALAYKLEARLLERYGAIENLPASLDIDQQADFTLGYAQQRNADIAAARRNKRGSTGTTAQDGADAPDGPGAPVS